MRTRTGTGPKTRCLCLHREVKGETCETERAKAASAIAGEYPARRSAGVAREIGRPAEGGRVAAQDRDHQRERTRANPAPAPTAANEPGSHAEAWHDHPG